MKNFYEWQYGLRDKINEVNSRLLESIKTDQEYLFDMAKYTIDAGGKRFRPLLTILSYEISCSEPYDKILDLAAGYELIHTASLIHDDIIDKSKYRRGRETLYSRDGVDNAIVVGDYLFAKAYELGSRYGKEVSKVMADGSSHLAEGQIIEALNIGNLSLDIETYNNIIKNKTAYFFSACAEGATMAAGADKTVRQKLSNFAFNMGMAFQITDDILDIVGNEQEMGKPTMVDLNHDVVTLPIIHALSNANPQDKKTLVGILKGEYKDADYKEKFREILFKTGSLEYAFKIAKDYILKSVANLNGIGRSDDLGLLMDLALIVVDRINESGVI
ncbi:polyprenyl synthetase family protein [Ferroplasma sp.]|uniref:polyprenyl synthetase family protein n=1 Tax=Ferroplasma sp. TaxID=2591003 RepID=UPI00262C03C9|nr:polyprenyl synthetase family protein [Ferroplasma sp.]MCL4453960.1 polyprenyl synthetase family protein [Candidatus Thermoplasmatota archaeon]